MSAFSTSLAPAAKERAFWRASQAFFDVIFAHRRVVDVRAVDESDSPVGHGEGRVQPGGLGEGALGLVVVEGERPDEALVKGALGLGRPGGDGPRVRPEVERAPGCAPGVLRDRGRPDGGGNDDGDRQDREQHERGRRGGRTRELHGDLPAR